MHNYFFRLSTLVGFLCYARIYESVDLVDFFKIDPDHTVYSGVELCYMLWVACVFGSKSTDSSICFF